MLIKVLKSKVHRATVTDAHLEYVGSLTLDEDLMDAVGLIAGELVLVADIDNGTRHETYLIAGARGEGTVCVNGAAARLVGVGDKIIIMAWALLDPDEAKSHKPKIVVVDEKNHIQ